MPVGSCLTGCCGLCGNHIQAWQACAKGAMGEVHAFEPHDEGSPVVQPNGSGNGPSSVGSHQFVALAGHHIAPAVLSSGSNVYEAFGPGFTLIALGAGAGEVQAFRDAAAALKLPLGVVEDARAGEAARYEARLVLVRPDCFVAWTSDTPGVDEAKARAVLTMANGG